MILQIILLALGLLFVVGYSHITTSGTTKVALKTPFWGEAPRTVHLTVDPVDFDDSDWVTDDGYLIPGCPLQADGTLATGEDEPAKFIVPYPTKIAADNTTAVLTAAPDQMIGVATRGDLSQAIIEANVARVLTADEIANIEASGRFVFV